MSSSSQPKPPPASTTNTNTNNNSTTNTNNNTNNNRSNNNPDASTEQSLREELHKLRKKISKREPLDASYNFLLLKNSYVKPPRIHRDKLYKKFGANLRESVEVYMTKFGTESPAVDSRKLDVGRHRRKLDVGKMKDAFTIRECKEHEQKDLIKASLRAANARCLPGNVVNEGTRKRSIEAMALGLLEGERKKKQKEKDRKLLVAARQKMLDAEKQRLVMKLEVEQAKISTQSSSLSEAHDTSHMTKVQAQAAVSVSVLEEKLRLTEQQSKDVTHREMEDRARSRAIEVARSREKEREKERQATEKRERERIRKEREVAARRARQMETPQQALHRLYEPIFTSLWDMEFWDGLNPFRIVIDKTNCASMGAPDYCDVIEKPMNLTYIRENVNRKHYMTLQDFFGDVELLISNALLYNSDPNNQYHIAANKMKSKYIELRKKLILQIEVAKAT